MNFYSCPVCFSLYVVLASWEEGIKLLDIFTIISDYNEECNNKREYYSAARSSSTILALVIVVILFCSAVVVLLIYLPVV